MRELEQIEKAGHIPLDRRIGRTIACTQADPAYVRALTLVSRWRAAPIVHNDGTPATVDAEHVERTATVPGLVGVLAGPHGAVEQPGGAFEHFADDGDALGVVGVEERGRGVAAEDEGELPGKIGLHREGLSFETGIQSSTYRVLDGRVHALTSSGAVGVRRIYLLVISPFLLWALMNTDLRL